MPDAPRTRRLIGRRRERGQSTGDQLVGVMLVIVIAAAIGFIGTDVNADINDSISVAGNSAFSDAQDNLSTGYADAMGLTDVVFIVLLFSVILAALLAFRGGRI